MKRRRLNPLITDEQIASPEVTPSWAAPPSLGFDFGFNNPKFSNYVLHIKVEDDREGGVVPTPDDGEACKRKRRLLDATSVSIHVNSLLLSAHSDFFRSLFTHDMQESRASEVNTSCWFV